MNCVRLKTAGKTVASWILLTNAGITAREAAQYDDYRWRIESDCKLLKSAGYRVEGWQQETGERICKRLLIVAQSYLQVWRLQSDRSEAGRRLCEFLMRLSGRQTKKGREITALALLEGMLKLLSAQELLEFMTAEEIRGTHGVFGV